MYNIEIFSLLLLLLSIIAAMVRLIEFMIAVCLFVLLYRKVGNLFRYASIFVDKNESFFSFPVFADVLGHKKNGPHVWEPSQQNRISSESDRLWKTLQ